MIRCNGCNRKIGRDYDPRWIVGMGENTGKNLCPSCQTNPRNKPPETVFGQRKKPKGDK